MVSMIDKVFICSQTKKKNLFLTKQLLPLADWENAPPVDAASFHPYNSVQHTRVQGHNPVTVYVIKDQLLGQSVATYHLDSYN